MGQAILIVDMQNDFMPGGALPVPNGDLIIPKINALMERSPNSVEIITTQDWHPANTPHFDKWPVHCVAGTKGAELDSRLVFPRYNHACYKGIGESDGYSAFKGTVHLLPFLRFLRDQDINKLYVCGVATEYCVYQTVQDALLNKIETALVVDCIAGIMPTESAKAIEDMAFGRAELINSVDIPF